MVVAHLAASVAAASVAAAAADVDVAGIVVVVREF